VAWKDHSPYANDVETYGTMTLQSADATHNFQPYFSNFSASNYFQHQKFPGNLSGSTHYTNDQSAFAVVRATAAGNGTIVGVDYYKNYAISPRFGVQAGKQMFVSYYPTSMSQGFRPAISEWTLPVGTSAVLGWTVNHLTLAQRMNGNPSLTTFKAHHESYGQYYTIGYGQYNDPTNAGQGAFPGDIQEVIWYNTGISAYEAQKVESYLALKYGISLSQTTPTDYLASEGSIVWNAANAGVYKQQIAGIGRDYTSSLNQKQSRSVEGDTITIGLGTIAPSNAENPAYFTTDTTFLTWANNGERSTDWSGTNTLATFYSLPKSWQLQLVGKGVGEVQLRAVDLPEGQGYIFLLLDDDGDFTNGGTQPLLMTNNAEGWEVEFTPTDAITYFTIATKDSQEIPTFSTSSTSSGCDTPDITIGSYTIAACNLGASVAGTGEASYGNYYQRGNNYGFANSGSLTTTSDTKPDASGYGPNSRYESGTFITAGTDWSNVQNDNLR
jgi:hypothetical protein